jgi:uncharacterized protein
VRPTILYLHGFASSPDSHKGRAFAQYLGERSYYVERLDLRLPNRDELRVSAMIDHVVERAAVHERVVIVGSSLGGLVAAHAAARTPTVGLVLMAPAFDFARRWAERLGPERLVRWQAGERVETPDHAGGPPLSIDFGFYEDAARIDQPIATTVPTLVFHGRNDEVVDFAGSEAFVERAGQARLVALGDDHGLIESLPTILGESFDFIESLHRPNVENQP